VRGSRPSADETESPDRAGSDHPASAGEHRSSKHAAAPGPRRFPSRLRGKRSWAALAAVVVLVLGLVAGGVLAGRMLLGHTEAAYLAPAPLLRIGPLPADAPTPTGPGLTTALRGPTTADGLGTLTGEVLDPATGRTLWSRSPDEPMQPGSAAKLLTMAAVLLTLGPTDRIPTKVVAGPTPDSVILVGGGDPTLTALPEGGDSVYPDAPRLDNLAHEVRTAHPGPINRVYIDLSRFTGAGVAPGWDEADIKGGNFTPIEPLILDGGRSKPDELDPPRSAHPAQDTGEALAQRLGADQAHIERIVAPPNAPVLGEVASAPIPDLVQTALRISDNVLAESLARQVALANGSDPSFAGAAAAVRAALTGAGFDTAGVTMVDGSGLSTADEVPARLLGAIVTAAAGPTGSPRADQLRPLLAGLPVAGGSGTLEDRFTGKSADGKGYVRAKTGTLTGVSTLAGQVTDTDGRLLTFVFMSNGASPAQTRPRLDALAATLRDCGCR
jgi:D-alanyl-D-alanine carboxypeptidase/D-alanyl-D-alanine-endopeptidase (penicillin-binding protein 4)